MTLWGHTNLVTTTFNNTLTFIGQLSKEASGIFLSAESQCASQIQSKFKTKSRRKLCVFCELLYDLVYAQLSSHFPTFPVLGIPQIPGCVQLPELVLLLHISLSLLLLVPWPDGSRLLQVLQMITIVSFPSLLGTRDDFAALHPL